MDHCNGNAPLANEKRDSILVLKGATFAFVSLIGSSRNVDPEILSERLQSEVSLLEWSYHFILVEITDSDIYTKSDLK